MKVPVSTLMRHVSWLSTQTWTWGGSNRFSLVLMTKRNRPSMTTVGILGLWKSGYQVVTLRASALQDVSGIPLVLLRLLFSRCLSLQVGQRVWPGMAGLEQLRHWPRSLAFCRFSWAKRRRYSMRSGVWLLARSYSRRVGATFCLEASVSSGVLLGLVLRVWSSTEGAWAALFEASPSTLPFGAFPTLAFADVVSLLVLGVRVVLFLPGLAPGLCLFLARSNVY